VKTTLQIQGMHCQSCVRKLTAAFEKLPGVRSAAVTLSPDREGRASIESDGPVALGALTAAADAAGDYTVKLADTTADQTPSTAHTHHESHAQATPAPSEPTPSLYPLFLIVGYILGVSALAAFIRSGEGWRGFMLDFMAGFFLVFSFFKFLNLRGFADAYQTYDIVARRSRAYALVYPFIELALGVAYLLRWQLEATNAVTLALMLIGSVGVLRAVLDRRRIRCACLGTALNLPMTTITVFEDLGMAAMAAAMTLLPSLAG
jgi:copper chaperone CopZ